MPEADYWYCACCNAPSQIAYETCPKCGTEGEWMTEEEFYGPEENERRSPVTDTNQSNVTSIESKQVAPSCRFTITATLGGFPITIEGEGRAGDLKVIIDRLKAIGAEPPQSAIRNPQSDEPTKKAAPLCPVHHSPMKEGRRGYFCPKKVGDDYCKEVA